MYSEYINHSRPTDKWKDETPEPILHDLSKVETYFDELILLNKEIIETGKVETVFVEENIARAYESQFSFLKPMKVGV